MKTILTRLFNHEELSSEETRRLLLAIIDRQYPEAQVAALLTAFQMRGITVDELIGFRQAYMETALPVDLSPYRVIDIVGTGGDGKNTFNISTCACFVVAGAGYAVAKHGNVGATSVSGASNVMELHGVRFTTDPDRLRRSIDACGMAYLHAPLFNAAMKHVAPIRRQLGVRTLFNLLGPLVNPSRPAYQLLGVADLAQLRLYTNVFHRLGIDFAVVNSFDSYDEISLTDEFKVMTRRYERIYRPHQLGFSNSSPAELYGGDTTEEAAEIFDAVLENRATAAQTQCVLVNAAFAIQTIEADREIEDCIAIARRSLESGRALATLRKLIDINSKP
jgi:anthranilate phosphoribosyltransferase